MKIIWFLILIIPNITFAKLSFVELDSSNEQLNLLYANLENWGFKDWDDMKNDPDINVEEYKLFIATRCGGLFQAKLEIFNKFEDNKKNLFSMMDTMNDLIFKYASPKYNDNLVDDNLAYEFSKKTLYKGYYKELFNFSHNNKFILSYLIRDEKICEKHYSSLSY